MQSLGSHFRGEAADWVPVAAATVPAGSFTERYWAASRSTLGMQAWRHTPAGLQGLAVLSSNHPHSRMQPVHGLR